MSPSLLAFEILDPRGRCNRKGLLIIAIVLLALQLVAGALASLGVLQRGGPAMRIAEVTFVLAAFSATSKRLHDLGLSAWWILAGLGGLAAWSVVLALVLVFTVGAAALQPGALGFVIAVVGTMAPAFAATLWLHLARGDVGENRFGSEPDASGFSARSPAAARFGTPVHSARA